MSNLKQLINNLCPDGVEYLKICELVNYEQPKKYIVKSTKYNDKFSIPVLTAGQTFILGYTDEKENIYNASNENPVIIFDDFTGAFKWVNFPFKVKSSAMKILKSNEEIVMLRYIYHMMGKINFSSSAHKRLWISTYSDFKIPVPPLEVQHEIVRILDLFTNLTAELTAELTARKKQYEYYRDKLLNFGDDVKRKTLGEVFYRIKGTPITAKQMREIEKKDGDIKIFAGGKTVINAFEKDIKQANITRVPAVIVQSRGIIDFIYYDKPFTFKNEMWAYTTNEKVSVKFLYYYLKNNVNYFRNVASSMGSLPQISLPVTENLKIPVPPVDTQIKIVNILDKFEKLCNSLIEGIPAEINARKKQYEYYRDKLLNFKNLNG